MLHPHLAAGVPGLHVGGRGAGDRPAGGEHDDVGAVVARSPLWLAVVDVAIAADHDRWRTWRCGRVAIMRGLLLEQHDDDGTPRGHDDGGDGVGNGVAEDGDLALRQVLDRAQRGSAGARSGAGTEEKHGFILSTYLPKSIATSAG